MPADHVLEGAVDESIASKLPVEVPEKSPADELVEELAPRMSEEAERVLANRIEVDHNAALQDRLEWETRLAEWEDQYYNRVPDKDFPWVGSANFHVPLTMMGVESFKPKLIEAVLGQNPPLMVVPVQPADEERKDRTETFLNWQILSELNLAETITQSAHLFLQPGMAIAKTYWLVKRTKRKTVREFAKDTNHDAVLSALFGPQRPKELEKIDDLEWEGSLRAEHGLEDLTIRLKM